MRRWVRGERAAVYRACAKPKYDSFIEENSNVAIQRWRDLHMRHSGSGSLLMNPFVAE